MQKKTKEAMVTITVARMKLNHNYYRSYFPTYSYYILFAGKFVKIAMSVKIEDN